MMERKVKKFDDVFQAADLNMDKLRALSPSAETQGERDLLGNLIGGGEPGLQIPGAAEGLAVELGPSKEGLGAAQQVHGPTCLSQTAREGHAGASGAARGEVADGVDVAPEGRFVKRVAARTVLDLVDIRSVSDATHGVEATVHGSGAE